MLSINRIFRPNSNPVALVACRGFARFTPKRDPDRPMRPKTAFMIFTEELRTVEKAKDTKPTEVLKIAGHRWKDMSPALKKPFEDKATPLREAYDKNMKSYVDSGKKDAWARDPAMPKRPLTGYMLFAKEWRSKTVTNDLKVTEVTKQIGRSWKALPQTEKDKYNHLYQVEKTRYDKVMADYKSSGKLDQWKEKVGIAEQERQVTKKKEDQKAAARKLKEKERASKLKQQQRDSAVAKKLKEQERAAKLKQKARESLVAKKERAAKLKEKKAALAALKKQKVADAAAKSTKK